MESARSWKFIILLIILSFINGACVSRPTYTPSTTTTTKPSISPIETTILVTQIATSTKVPTPTATRVPNEDGLFRLTTNQAGDGDPDWDPEGKRIVFVSNREGIDEIYVLEIASNGLIRLTMDEVHEKFAPSWSPDGEKIAFNVVIDTVVMVKVLDVAQSSTSPLSTLEIIQLPALAGALDRRRVPAGHDVAPRRAPALRGLGRADDELLADGGAGPPALPAVLLEPAGSQREPRRVQLPLAAGQGREALLARHVLPGLLHVLQPGDRHPQLRDLPAGRLWRQGANLSRPGTLGAVFHAHPAAVSAWPRGRSGGKAFGWLWGIRGPGRA